MASGIAADIELHLAAARNCDIATDGASPAEGGSRANIQCCDGVAQAAVNDQFASVDVCGSSVGIRSCKDLCAKTRFGERRACSEIGNGSRICMSLSRSRIECQSCDGGCSL